MSDEKNGTQVPALEANPPAPGSPEHILGMIADQLNVILHNQQITGQAIAMILAGAAQQVLLKEEVLEMIRRLDPHAKFEQPSPILRAVPPPGRLS